MKEILGIMREAKNVVFQPQHASVLPQRLLYHRRMSIISNPKTYLQCQIFQTTKL